MAQEFRTYKDCQMREPKEEMRIDVEWERFERVNKQIKLGASVSDACRENHRTKKWWTEMLIRFAEQIPDTIEGKAAKAALKSVGPAVASKSAVRYL